MWGFNIFLDFTELKDIIEFDSYINIHNNQLHGYLRGGMDIKDEKIVEQALEVIQKWIQI